MPNDMRPVIVVGTGRSGTSTVSKLLIELGVDMGSGFRRDESNPDGFYEDAEIRDLNSHRWSGVVDDEEWSKRLRAVADKRETRSPGRWGWKDPRTSEYIGDVLRLFPDARCIWCTRNLDDTVSSYCRWYAMHPDRAKAIITRRWSNLAAALSEDVLTISVSDLATPGSVQERLRVYLGV